MDKNNLIPFSPTQFDEVNSKTLYRSICVPSTMHSYSLAIDYIKTWFLDHFDKGMFKTIHVEGKHVLDDYRKVDKIFGMLKRPKPSLAVLPSFSWDFNDENIDSYPYGLSLYSTSGRQVDSFFKDSKNDIYLGIGMRTILLRFTFRIRVETRAQQLDLYNYMNLAFRVGFSEGHDINLDFHIPYELMLQIAQDAGFEIVYNEFNMARIKNVTKFLEYLNSHSDIPFLYKYRNINGLNEFFIRMKDMYVHIKSMDMSADDGEREGNNSTNFIIEMSSDVRFPAPKMYAYYSSNEHKLSTVYTAENSVGDKDVTTFYSFKGYDMSDTNQYGWDKFLTTSYEEKDLTKPLRIEFDELFEGDLIRVIDYCTNTLISPAIFLDIIIINAGKRIHCSIDWELRTITTIEPVTGLSSFIAIYLDKEFFNSTIMRLDDDMKSLHKEVPLVKLRDKDKEIGK